uniref:Uncharacterized protein n=1 Tax=Rhizophora mucronata TaxID=61149 RepID=A0A2P2QTI6_RHIMU
MNVLAISKCLVSNKMKALAILDELFLVVSRQ